MSYSTKNLIKAIITGVILSVGFYFFFGQKLLSVSIAIGMFLSISMFFNPSKLEKAKKEAEHNKPENNSSSNTVNPKEISHENID